MCLKIILTPTCGDKRKKQPKYAQNFKGWLRFLTIISKRSDGFSKSRNPLLTFLLSYHVCVISKIQVNSQFEKYWWFCLMNFWNFLTIHVFGVKESITDISTELSCLGDLENPGRQASGSTRTRRYWWLCLVDFLNFFTIHVFEVRESFADIPTELPCLGKLENSGHLPVQEVFEVTQTFVPWQKCSKFISNRAKRRVTVARPMLYCQLYYHVTSCHIKSHHATSCHVMSRHVTSSVILVQEIIYILVFIQFTMKSILF